MIDRLQKYWSWELVAVPLLLSLPLTPAVAQQLGQGTDAADLTVWRMVAAFVFVAVLIAAAWLIVRHRGGALPFLQKPGDRRINILEIARVSPQSQICLLRFEDREYLIALTAQGAHVIETRVADEASGEA